MRAPSYEQKRDAAISQTARVEEAESIAGHPKRWDKYIEKRQKQVKEQSRARKS